MRPRRHRWPFVLLVLAVLGAAALVGLWQASEALEVIPLSITIDGEPLVRDLDLAALPTEHRLVLVAVAFFVLVMLALVLPLTLLITLGAVLLVAALPVMVALALLALLLSPLVLLGWLLWRALRPSPSIDA